MNKNTWLKLINPLLLISFVLQMMSGNLMSSSHFFYELHEGNGLVLVLLSAIHLVLNWSWVRTNFIKK